MVAKDLMQRQVVSVRDDMSLDELIDTLVREHIHGAPVVDTDGRLVGMVTQQDVFVSGIARGPDARVPHSGILVRDIMTAPAVCAAEDTEVDSLCRMMVHLRIHRVPIARDGRLVGIVSSLDVCEAVARSAEDT